VRRQCSQFGLIFGDTLHTLYNSSINNETVKRYSQNRLHFFAFTAFSIARQCSATSQWCSQRIYFFQWRRRRYSSRENPVTYRRKSSSVFSQCNAHLLSSVRLFPSRTPLRRRLTQHRVHSYIRLSFRRLRRTATRQLCPPIHAHPRSVPGHHPSPSRRSR